ncbi:MAG TPA: UDP-3-O-(3-hydroxymyristoyl)glucosamine N-acyltransferase, partial [Candidatus Dormibacteraeota bacterium]|nr:UDP-3-O-(3-hydroxymyristoyl)glucosamine N-acyltransferase [Candidatus Dormibacteraeota bacterium]
YLAAALRSHAAAILVDERALGDRSEMGKPLLVVGDARRALVDLLSSLRPGRPIGAERDPSASIDPSSTIGEGVFIGPHVTIGARSTIGAGCAIEAGAFIGSDVRIGESSWLHPQARVMDRCTIGAQVVLHSGATIGSEGFGWAFVDGRLERIPQVGNVELGDRVEIGANSCVDRAQTGSTRIGEGTKVDNLVQIGHNCHIGRHNAFAALVGLAGSTNVGDYVRVAGQSGFKGHITVGSRVTIGGQSQIWNDVPDDSFVSGAPARDHRERLRIEVAIKNLPKLIARVEALERTARDRTT